MKKSLGQGPRRGWLRAVGLLTLTLLTGGALAAQAPNYHTPKELADRLNVLQKQSGGAMKLELLTRSASNEPVYLVRIGQNSGKPAVLVVANPSGHLPIASEGALMLVEYLLADAKRYQELNWYLVPSLNPDAHNRYFARVKQLSLLNGRAVNRDNDDREGEDPADDLNGDGWITQMRVDDPLGDWLAVEGEPRLMRRANPQKGEKGRYKLYEEGIDNDGDGRYNEDGAGGVDIGITFPHLFPFDNRDAGEWSGSEDETYELIRFVNGHREIAMTLVLGETNFCFQPPQGGRKGQVDLSRITIPERVGRRFGFDTSRTYSMQEIMAEAQKMAPPGVELTEAMVASFLGLGAVVNPLPDDLKFYEAITEQYKAFLKEAKVSAERFDPKRDRDGSFELWSYYHMGLPSFSLDLWTLPKPEKKKEETGDELTMEKLPSLSNEAFLALGEEKIEAFLKVNNVPKQFNAAMIVERVKAGQLTPQKMAEMMKQMGGAHGEQGKGSGKPDPREEALLKYSDEKLAGKGFVNWTKYRHPTLGEVEIGGFVPYVDQNPPAAEIADPVKAQLPWILDLVANRAQLAIHSTEVKAEGAGVYRVKVWIENRGLISYPTAMGARNERTTPVVVTLEGAGIERLMGRKRELIPAVNGHSVRKVEWLIRADAPTRLTIKMSSNYAGEASKTLQVGGES